MLLQGVGVHYRTSAGNQPGGTAQAALNPLLKSYCGAYQLAFRLAMPPYREPAQLESIQAHAAREANPLYPVPRLMSAAELEQFYDAVAQ